MRRLKPEDAEGRLLGRKVQRYSLFFLQTHKCFRKSGIFTVLRLISLAHAVLFQKYKQRYQFSSVSQSYPTLCNPMNRCMPGLPVHHQLQEFTQTHVHRVSDAIQSSHPLSSPSPPAPNPPSIRVFSNESTLRMRWPKY